MYRLLHQSFVKQKTLFSCWFEMSQLQENKSYREKLSSKKKMIDTRKFSTKILTIRKNSLFSTRISIWSISMQLNWLLNVCFRFFQQTFEFWIQMQFIIVRTTKFCSKTWNQQMTSHVQQTTKSYESKSLTTYQFNWSMRRLWFYRMFDIYRNWLWIWSTYQIYIIENSILHIRSRIFASFSMKIISLIKHIWSKTFTFLKRWCKRMLSSKVYQHQLRWFCRISSLSLNQRMICRFDIVV